MEQLIKLQKCGRHVNSVSDFGVLALRALSPHAFWRVNKTKNIIEWLWEVK
jgi:hypothetical protein